MPSQKELDRVFLNVAKEIASMSKCVRAKVGALLVKDLNIVSFGYNGTPAGACNTCEDKMYVSSEAGAWIDEDTIQEKWPHTDDLGRFKLVTKDEVIHAESNVLLKAARMGTSTENSTMYCTLSPCKDCSKLILQSGVKRVVYLELFSRDNGSVDFLKQYIEVEKYE